MLQNPIQVMYNQ
uniref:Uncharacterized protein n=1 Tax=Arundo donax TaxID=35708 RepID=A0A0A9HB40_ARUDO